MNVRKLFSKVAASATIFSLAFTPDIAAACSFHAPVEVISDHMRQKCRSALASQKKFLANVKADHLKVGELGDYVEAFDEGKYGCRKNTGFVYRILDSYYSAPARLTSAPRLLRRYAFSWPDDADPNRRAYIYNLIWLFSDYQANLPYDLTPEKAAAFVARPEHWDIALARFGTARTRDDAVFANITDPDSPHFDREAAVRLSQFKSKHKMDRQLKTASLLIDPRFGPPDFAKAETLLPITALQIEDDGDPASQKARELWMQLLDGYASSDNAAQRERGRQLKAIMQSPSLAAWPTIDRPKDGKIWLSLNDWPKKIANPFADAKPQRLISVQDYPSRALRNEEVGVVAIAARFGPDGRFANVEIIQSSGSATLDSATVTLVQRRFRPKLSSDLTLSGYEGKEVRVPLLVVAWLMREGSSAAGGISSFADGKFTVIAEHMVNEIDDYGMCGPPRPDFL